MIVIVKDSMNTLSLSVEPIADLSAAGATQSAKFRMPDDMVMIRTAAELTRDLNAPKRWVYWTDFLGSALVGYAGLAVAVGANATIIAVLGAVIAVLALYRAGSFIHELTHIKHSLVPGFRLGWNVIIGIPLLIPSFMYEGVHSLHHARTRYGTVDDPEYLPLALMKPYTVPLFVVASAFGPIALLFRYAVLSPLSLLIPSLRSAVVARYSSLSTNPAFRRRAPEGELQRIWPVQEAATSLWAILLLVSVASGYVPLRGFLIALAIVSATLVFNQIRTLVAHLWENDGNVLSVTGQYLDSVNVPPPGVLPEIWAPVGLRYHALHHLLPGLPYHALGEAHRRLKAALPQESSYHGANYGGLTGLVTRLVGNTVKPRG